jgi:SSS family solute:Na+ symporter
VHHGLSLAAGATPGIKGGYLGTVLTYPSEMAQTFWTAIAAFTTCFVVTVVVSLATTPRHPAELDGLVLGRTTLPVDDARPWHDRPMVMGAAVVVLLVALNVAFF